jgi:hypothetical protein
MTLWPALCNPRFEGGIALADRGSTMPMPGTTCFLLTRAMLFPKPTRVNVARRDGRLLRQKIYFGALYQQVSLRAFLFHPL